MMTPEQLMQIAIDACRCGIAAGQTPFGCAIARDDEVIAACHNVVFATTDITAHAEINALRTACQHTGSILLEGCVVATTCEPCPMCMSALHWARVTTVYYGATIDDAAAAGFNELQLRAEQVVHVGGSQVRLEAGVLASECKTLFDQWLQRPQHQAY